MSELIDRFEAFLDRHPDLVPRESTVLVALSGGPDSTALLDLLARLRDSRRLDLYAGHFDHRARPGSETEAQWVARLAASLDVPCRIGRPADDLEPKQAAFRAARYDFLRREAGRIGADRIATGHQADDQAETVLFRLERGTGLRGLAGIPRRRGAVVRPLLHCWREEILEYLDARGVPWLDDPSNRDPRWARARIRHHTLPTLERAGGPKIRRELVRMARAARRLDRSLDGAARRALEEARAEDARPADEDRLYLRLGEFASRDEALQARAIRLAARRFGARLSAGGTRAGVEFIRRGRSGAAIDLADGLRIGRQFGTVWIGPPATYEPDRELEIVAPASGAGDVSIGGRTYGIVWGEGEALGPSGSRPDPDWRVALPLHRLEFPLKLRGPRPGDRIRLAAGSRKLKKLFGDRRVSRWERPRVPVLTDGAGTIWWVAGVARAVPEEVECDERRFVLGVRPSREGAARGGRSAR